MALDVGDIVAVTSDGRRGQGKNALRGSPGEIDGQASNIGSERVGTQGGDGQEEPFIIKKASITETGDSEDPAMDVMALRRQASGTVGGNEGVKGHSINLVIEEHESRNTSVEHNGLVGEHIKCVVTHVSKGIEPGREEPGTVGRGRDERGGERSRGGRECGRQRKPRLGM